MDTTIGPGPIIKYHNQKEDFHVYAEAGFLPRGLAFLIDSSILGLLQTAGVSIFDEMTMRFAPADSSTLLLGVLFWGLNAFMLPALYYVPQMKVDGSTIGKRTLGLRVLRTDDSPELSILRILLRDVLGKLLSMVFFGAGFLVRAFGLETFHDKVAKTKVVSLRDFSRDELE